MPTEEWERPRINHMLKKLRLENQKKNNLGKPELITEDVLETADFVFSPIKPLDRVGDSGNLLLAKRKNNRSEQYLVKHEYCDCAANEFVYSKLARAMGLHVPVSKLFLISKGEKRNYFKSGYTVGAEYLKLQDKILTYEVIRSSAVNWKEYHSFRALYYLFLESDSFEIVLTEDNYIYRVDTSGSFNIDDMCLRFVGLDIDSLMGNIQQKQKERLEKKNSELWAYVNFHKIQQDSIARYGEECKEGFLKPFYDIQEIQEGYIEDFLNTLCYFYPDFVGDYYRRFIKAAQKKAREFLASL